jgi:hypothetical protein
MNANRPWSAIGRVAVLAVVLWQMPAIRTTIARATGTLADGSSALAAWLCNDGNPQGSQAADAALIGTRTPAPDDEPSPWLTRGHGDIVERLLRGRSPAAFDGSPGSSLRSLTPSPSGMLPLGALRSWRASPSLGIPPE